MENDTVRIIQKLFGEKLRAPDFYGRSPNVGNILTNMNDKSPRIEARIRVYKSPFFWPGTVSVINDKIKCKRSFRPPIAFWYCITSIPFLIILLNVSRYSLIGEIIHDAKLFVLLPAFIGVVLYLVHLPPANIPIGFLELKRKKLQMFCRSHRVFGSYVDIQFLSLKDYDDFKVVLENVTGQILGNYATQKFRRIQ